MQRDFHYPLAFTTLACPDWSWEQVVQKAVEYGYQGLELLGLPVKLRQAKQRIIQQNKARWTVHLSW